ncbi:protein mono-ADP-ribosyltransferase PARP6 isoform X5 [Oenanthe melanoleuca]|uniref:protein mono-ADP-ribosyltransferase PARP6 isoform X5 n=1 Tax=Oenanthe melanoleuca TaxID=2939378 RepID=UPI0024C16C34|nr:protein mono-ADP-ribosyltransferase PARP6 isoform X5 [Oenanthe melanoleuca]
MVTVCWEHREVLYWVHWGPCGPCSGDTGAVWVLCWIWGHCGRGEGLWGHGDPASAVSPPRRCPALRVPGVSSGGGFPAVTSWRRRCVTPCGGSDVRPGPPAAWRPGPHRPARADMDLKGQYWTDDDSDGDNESEEFLYGVQGTCAADLYRHPQLDADIEAVKEIYSENAVAVREYGTIDDVDIDLHVNISFLDEEVATAWKVLRTEPIVLRLRFSLSQYLDGPEPSIEVFQPSNKEGFGLGLQLKKILGMFTSQQWKHLSNDFLKTQQEKRHSWFKTSGTIKKFRAGLSIFSPIPKSPSFPVIQDSVLKGKLGIPEPRVNRLMNRSVSCMVKNPKVEVFGYPPASTQAGVAPFNILVGGHCKNIPTLEYGFLVQIMKYAEQRIPTLNEYCVVCDEQHVFQNGSMLKPAVCTRELCVFSFYTLGVMSGAAEEVATGAEVVDLLVAMCRAALESPRKSIIFEPYPSVVDPNDPKTLAFNPKKKNYERLQKALDSVMSIREMTQGSYLEIKKQMDKLDPLAHPLLQWIISSNRSHIVKLPLSRQLKFMHTSHQFLLLSSPPAKEARFRTAKKLYGSTFAFHGSHIENWHSILRNGLVNASYTKLQEWGKGSTGCHRRMSWCSCTTG